jgi:hypothetical protein
MEGVLVVLAPMVVFGLVAVAALLWGAESRPGFDEKPVVDDRPNLFPIPRSGEPAPVSAAPAAPRPVRQRPASATSAATSPSGVWSAASTAGS